MQAGVDRLDTAGRFRNLVRFPYWRRAAGALEPLRKALGYTVRQEVIPTQPNVSLGARAVYDQRVTLPPGSFLYAISGSSAQAQGFTIQLTDFGTASTLFAAPIPLANLAGNIVPAGIVDAAGAAVVLPWPLHLLNIPRPIIEPGIINAQVTNLATVPNRIQLVLWFFVPTAQPEGRNAWNDLLDAESALFRRIAGGSTTAAATAGGAGAGFTPPPDPALLLPANNQTINATVVGALPAGNVIVGGVSGFRVAIHQLSLYNAAQQQTIRLLNGAGADAVDLIGPLTDYPAAGGYGLTYQAEPHFVTDDGAPFTINLTDTQANGGGPVTGFCKYRLLRTWTPGGAGN